MTTPPTFPTLAGRDIRFPKKPTFSTIVAGHVSGREVRNSLYVNPIWEFELTYNGLDGTAGGQYGALGAQSYQALLGLFLQCQGQFGEFLFVDDTDHQVTAGAIGTGDGTTTTFPLARAIGGFLEPVGWATAVSNVYLAGVNQTTGWSVATPNSLIFAAAPASGVAITASFSFAFLCRFADDAQTFEQFMSNLWKADGVKFRSLRMQ